uniref:Myotubularin phosphatase domain-containing protein n=1 Tax=Macrostomum lignano TaxID=282301 RepID=A0A1I8IW62_9PLAT
SAGSTFVFQAVSATLELPEPGGDGGDGWRKTQLVKGHEDKELTEMPPSPTMTSSATTLNGSIHEQEEPDNSIRARNGSIIIDQHQQLSAHELQDALNRTRSKTLTEADDVDDADDGARDETGPKLLPADSLLPGERYRCSGLDSTSLLIVLTNYRLLLLRQPPADVESAASISGRMEPAELRLIESLPVFLIERLQALDGLQLQLHCKDGRCNLPRLYFDSLPELNQWAERLDPTRLSPLLDCQGATYFPYLFKKTIRRRQQQQQPDAEPVDMGYEAHYTEKSFIDEAKRLGFLGDNSGWCVTKLNSDRSLCQSYPRLHLLPASVTEDELRQSSGYRALGRFPAPVWRCRANGAVLARSAQPLVGLAGFLGWRCEPDEKLVRMLTSDAAKKVCASDCYFVLAELPFSIS